MKMQSIVTDLLGTGLSEKALGDLVGLSQAQIHRLKTGDSQDTNYTSGKKLVQLHAERVLEQAG